MSKRLQQIASHALDNPSELALETIAAVAQRAGVQPSSLIRFAKVFGFSGYSEMQRVFRLRLTDAMPDYKERLRSLRTDHGRRTGEGFGSSLLDQFVQADIVGPAVPFAAAANGRAARAGDQADCRLGTVYLVAHRRSFPVAFTSLTR